LTAAKEGSEGAVLGLECPCMYARDERACSDSVERGRPDCACGDNGGGGERGDGGMRNGDDGEIKGKSRGGINVGDGVIRGLGRRRGSMQQDACGLHCT
jgi:hypothetical protein